jgi:hypothetical protein
LKTLALGCSSLWSLETGFPTRDCGPPMVKTFPLGIVFHISLSLLRIWYFGDARHISPQVRPSPWELDHPKFLQTPHWDVSWPTLDPSA